MTRKFIQRSIGNELDIAGDIVTNYKPLTNDQLDYLLSIYRDKMDDEDKAYILIEQARRANALASMAQYTALAMDWIDNDLTRALAAYRGEG